jgi:peroxiredoxin Q/BCP
MATKKKTKKSVKKAAPKKAAKKTSKKAAVKPAKKAAKAAPKKAAPKKTAAPKSAPKKSLAKTAVKFATKVVKAVGSVLGGASIENGNDLLAAGAPAPAFSLTNDEGLTVSLTHFSGKKVVLYFYPKDDTPGCTKESCDFRDSFARVKSAGAVVLGVSKDSVKSHQKFKAKFSLPFSLLSDEAGKMLEAYRVWKEKSNYGKTYMGIDRTTYLIDVDMEGKGTVRKVYPKVKVEGHVDEILKDLGAKG